MTCRVLVADPPWAPRDKLPGRKRGMKRGAASNYDVLPTREICRFPLPPIADDAHLFLWRLASMVPDAMAVVEAWGFVAKSELIWSKSTAKGKRHFGMGRTVRAEHEVCIIATRGRPKVLDHSVRSIFTAPVGRHSEKPDEFFDIITRLCGSPQANSHVEMFARKPRPWWTTYGNELEQAHPEAA